MGDEAPKVWDTETGDVWITGHCDRETAVKAFREYMAECGVPDWGDVPDDEITVENVWYRDAHDPKTDERWDRCDQDDEGAEAFTRVIV